MTFTKQIMGAAALGTALLTGLASVPAQAGYVVTLQEVGSGVVANGSGPIDLRGLSFLDVEINFSFLIPPTGAVITGPTRLTSADVYLGITGPGSFGSVPKGFLATNGSGDIVGVNGSSFALAVPNGYVSGAPLSDTSTYAGETFATLGVTPGTYEWTWGTGGPDQNFTLIIGGTPATVPEPTSLALLGTALARLLMAGAIGRIRSTS